MHQYSACAIFILCLPIRRLLYKQKRQRVLQPYFGYISTYELDVQLKQDIIYL